MIYAQHKIWAELIFHPYVTWLVKKHFHQIHIYGEIPVLSENLPLLVLPTHSNWWDGFFVYLINRKYLKRSIYLMMLEEQLKKYGFFAKVGAYSIHPGNAKSVLESMKYTLSLLNKTDKPPAVCLFPQGELQPWNKQLELKRGAEWLINKHRGSLQVLLLAMKIEFLGHQHPDVFVSFKDLGKINKNNFTGISGLKNKLEALKSEIDQRILNNESGDLFLRGARSISDTIDKIKSK